MFPRTEVLGPSQLFSRNRNRNRNGTSLLHCAEVQEDDFLLKTVQKPKAGTARTVLCRSLPKFAKLSESYCHGISQEKRRLCTTFPQSPPPRSSSKTQILLVLSFQRVSDCALSATELSRAVRRHPERGSTHPAICSRRGTLERNQAFKC